MAIKFIALGILRAFEPSFMKFIAMLYLILVNWAKKNQKKVKYVREERVNEKFSLHIAYVF